jgi:tRNA A37 threonylcarbamoyladenosine biosynthesis protein TsaE
LDTPEQIVGAGLEEYFYQSDGVTVVEWIERYPIKNCRRAQIDTLGDSERRITYEDSGA